MRRFDENNHLVQFSGICGCQAGHNVYSLAESPGLRRMKTRASVWILRLMGLRPQDVGQPLDECDALFAIFECPTSGLLVFKRCLRARVNSDRISGIT
jgi:hypothetical protein